MNPSVEILSPLNALYRLENGEIVSDSRTRRPKHCAQARFLFPHPCMQDVWVIPMEGGIALVDSQDVPKVVGTNWYLHEGYVKSSRKKSGDIRIHNIILPVTDGVVDHKNRNAKDNRRSNLRNISQRENTVNRTKTGTHYGRPCTSKYKGVSWHKKRKKWVVQGNHSDGRRYLIGHSFCEEEAARIYDNYAANKWGDKAVLNFHV